MNIYRPDPDDCKYSKVCKYKQQLDEIYNELKKKYRDIESNCLYLCIKCNLYEKRDLLKMKGE